MRWGVSRFLTLRSGVKGSGFGPEFGGARFRFESLGFRFWVLGMSGGVRDCRV